MPTRATVLPPVSQRQTIGFGGFEGSGRRGGAAVPTVCGAAARSAGSAGWRAGVGSSESTGAAAGAPAPRARPLRSAGTSPRRRARRALAASNRSSRCSSACDLSRPARAFQRRRIGPRRSSPCAVADRDRLPTTAQPMKPAAIPTNPQVDRDPSACPPITPTTIRFRSAWPRVPFILSASRRAAPSTVPAAPRASPRGATGGATARPIFANRRRAGTASSSPRRPCG